MQHLIMCGLSTRVEALAFKVWRDYTFNMIQTANYKHNKDNQSIIHAIRFQLDNFERDLAALKEVTTILELSLWKLKVNDHCLK